MATLPNYAELHCISNYSFLRGASHPDELIQRASRLGYQAIAITDECSLAGIVKAQQAAKKHSIKLIIGSEFQLGKNLRLVLLAKNNSGYQQLCRLITHCRCSSAKGEYKLSRKDLYQAQLKDCIVLWLFDDNSLVLDAILLRSIFHHQLYLSLHASFSGKDKKIQLLARQLSESLQIPICASGNVHMHLRTRKPLLDVLTAIRFNTSISELGYKRSANSEYYLRSLSQLEQIHTQDALQQSADIAACCEFSLDQLEYHYPLPKMAPNTSAITFLRMLVMAGLKLRWPQGTSVKIHSDIDKELRLIQEMGYEAYFLTVYDIVCFARSRGILCQGRGSAANSVVCYCLQITNVNPDNINLLFERFISKERNEPPDIDIDFEHERREEVIQYIYKKYGRKHAALAAAVITYRPRSAIRDVGKALNFPSDAINRFAKSIHSWDKEVISDEQTRHIGFKAEHPQVKRLLNLVDQIMHFPRHLSQHVGGFLISEQDLSSLVPIENAAMPERTIIQWDKEDLETLGFLKIDILSLGMLSMIRKALDYSNQMQDANVNLNEIPTNDPAVYKMISKADTIGVFQIESRAQMSMLPRLQPRNYYDLVIQIAIVRPGPIQGEMVHPYLKRRQNPEQVQYPNADLEKVLKRTLGIPIFQEQVMQLAISAAGFTAGEADQLRRSMAASKSDDLDQFKDKLLNGMKQRGYSIEFADQLYRQIKGFGEYGFPESHAASFALLSYISAWLKHYHHTAFTCALLNSQPMGFYAPAQLIYDAKRHGVTVLPVDINRSQHDSYIPQQNHLQLGFKTIKGLSRSLIQRIIQAREKHAFNTLEDLAYRADCSQADLKRLVTAGTVASLAGHQHRAYWQSLGIDQGMPLFKVARFNEASALLSAPTAEQNTLRDYQQFGFSLDSHPMSFLRPELDQQQVHSSSELSGLTNNSIIKVAVLVIGRQQPKTASGVVFISLEDEAGSINVIVWPSFAQAQRKALLKANVLLVSGTLQKESGILHVIAGRLEDYSQHLDRLALKKREFD